MDLSEIKTVDLIKAVIERGISAHDYQLIYSNHIKTELRDYQERQRKRSEERNRQRAFEDGEFTLVRRDDSGNIIGGEALNDAHVTRVYDESNNLIAYRIDRDIDE